MRVTCEARYNFDKHGLAGCDFDVLPFLRVFPPKPYGWHATWTVHFGWLFWTVLLHSFPDTPAVRAPRDGTP